MAWPKLDVVVGQSATDQELSHLHESAAASASAISRLDAPLSVDVHLFEDAQLARPTFQERAHWCWAACLQAIFRHRGVEITQEEIVRRVYGVAVDLPELTPAQLYHVVNAEFPGADGSAWLFHGRYYPGALLTPPVLHAELAAQRPVMAVHKTGPATGHAVVLYGATFHASGEARVKYFDPTPGCGLGTADARALEDAVLRWFAIDATKMPALRAA